MELEFVQTVNISPEKAHLVRKAAEDSGVALTCHAPYYINLNSLDKEKMRASVERLLKAGRVAWACGAWSVAFHPGFYGGHDPYGTVRENLKLVMDSLAGEQNKIWIRPETTGKASQFGSLDELLKLCAELGTMPCVDYAHLHAREGKVNTYGEFFSVLERIEKELGGEAVRNMHIQIAGVEYSAAGERRHLELAKSDLNFKDIVRSWKEFSISGVVISESPDIEGDALLLKKLYENMDA
jgi:deoxyribonuclease-4